MLADRYIRSKLVALPGGKGLAFTSPEAARRLPKVRTLILASAEPFYVGRPRLSQYFAVQDQTFQTKQEVLSIAGSLGSSTRNTPFEAISVAAHEAGLVVREVDGDLLGDAGVTAKLERTWYVLGSEAVMEAEEIELGVSSRTLMQRLENDGKDVVFLAQKQPKRLLGIFALEHQVRPEAPGAIAAVRVAGLEPVLVTGQKTRTAKAFAVALGIEQVHSEVSPEGKRNLLASFQKTANAPAFVVTEYAAEAVPPGALRIGVGGCAGDVMVGSLVELPELMGLAAGIVAKARRIFFWCTL